MKNTLWKTFLNPPSEFSPIPFWFWNDQLTEAEITRQIEDFASKGVMGFVIHPRKGIPTEIPYLSDTYMHYVKHAVMEAARLNMHVVLYDEAMYPSGSAHGLVVKSNPEYATRALRMEALPIVECENTASLIEAFTSRQITDNECVLAAVGACLNARGEVMRESLHVFQEGDCIRPADVLFLLIETYSGGHIRGVHLGEDDGEAGAPPSGDLLNPEAMAKFIKITHERYYEVLKEYFGSTVIAMFTDEPDVLGRGPKEGSQAWTVGFDTYWQQFGGKICDLPLLWCNAQDNSHEEVRKQFRKAVYKRLSEAYYGQISQWCTAHNIALTGHPAQSDDIGLLKHFHIPGQDVVWRWVAPEDEKGIVGRNATMGKCSSDAARHSGKRRNANECFGCCGPNGVHWAFTGDDMKWYLDWLFVRGVNLLYPHAFFYSVNGEDRFGERPPDVGPNNTFWPHYKLFADYIRRMCWLLTDSYNTTPIAVLGSEDHLPWEPAKELFCGQLEFNYLEDNLLLDGSCRQENGWLKIRKQSYRIVLADTRTATNEDTAEILADFTAAGGHVIYWDQERQLVDAVRDILAGDPNCPRQIRVSPKSAAKDLRVTHAVKEGQDFYLIVNEGETQFSGTVLLPHGAAGVELWDAWNAACAPAAVTREDEGVLVPLSLGRRESMILCVDEEAGDKCAASVCPPVFHMLKDLPCDIWHVTAGDLTFHTAALTDWTTWNGMEDFSGTAVYEASFDYGGVAGEIFILDLGNVREFASVTVNGIPVGTRFWAPFCFDITDALREGTNAIRIEVTNTPANRIMHAMLPSGLILT